MREITIFIENLTGAQFDLANVNVKTSLRSASEQLPAKLGQASKLRWQVGTEAASVTFEYRSANESSSGGDVQRLVVVAKLPLQRQIFGKKKPSFAVNLQKIDAASFAARDASMAPLVPEPRPLEPLEQCAGEGCEWFAVSSDAKTGIEVRLRLMASDELPPMLASFEPAPSSPTVGNEQELEALEGFRRMSRAAEAQRAALALRCDREPLDASRPGDLSESMRIDLLLAVLGALLWRLDASVRWTGSADADAMQEVGESSPAENGFARLHEALVAHMKLMHGRMVHVLGFEGEMLVQKLTDLSSQVFPTEANGYVASSPPNSEQLCSNLCVGLNAREDTTGEEKDAAPEWSSDDSARIGSIDTSVALASAVMLMDIDVASSLEIAVRLLNAGAYPCQGDCCMVFSRPDDAYHLLFRSGQRDAVLGDLGATVEESGQLVLEDVAPPDLRLANIAIPRSWLVARDILALLLGSSGGAYDARSRAAMMDVFSSLGVPVKLAARWEAEFGGILFDALEASTALEKERARGRGWNRKKVAAAAAGGGLLLAVSGGLAAPAVAVGITALGTSAATAGAAVGFTSTGLAIGSAITGAGVLFTSLGTVGAGVIFGATGAGLAGFKLSRRWGDLHEFVFVPVGTTMRTVNVIVKVIDTAEIRKLDTVMDTSDFTVAEEIVVQGTTGDVAVMPGSVLQGRHQCEDESVEYRFERMLDSSRCAVHVVVFVSGWIRDRAEDFTRPWEGVADQFFPSSGHLALRWEPDWLAKLNEVFAGLLARQTVSSSVTQWFTYASASAAAAGSVAVASAAWPIWIISALSNLDNVWIVCTERAHVAGKCLAHALADRQTVGQRPVTLVGHSMGARLLINCLLELYKIGAYHVVDSVVLLGAPATTRAEKWHRIRAVVSGRVVNGYLKNDWVLAFLYRYLEWGVSVAGLSEVKVRGVENVDLSNMGISGHGDYTEHLPNILARMRIGDRGRIFAQ